MHRGLMCRESHALTSQPTRPMWYRVDYFILPFKQTYKKHNLAKIAIIDWRLTFLASCVRGLVPAKSVNQLLMELCDLAVTSQKLSFWLTCGLRFPVSVNVLIRSFSAMMLLKFELICKTLKRETTFNGQRNCTKYNK